MPLLAVMTIRSVLPILLAAALVAPTAANGQAPTSAQTPTPDPDRVFDPLQPDFTVVALPTTLRLPSRRSAFRVTHRFTRPLNEGSTGELFENLFGFDSGALIGLEYRYGLLPGTQIGVHRTSTRIIQLLGQHNILNERGGAAFGLDAIVTFEGDNNLREHRKSAIGAVVSRSLADRATLYAEPIWVVNANPEDVGDDGTLLVGLGTRLRLSRVVYVSVEASPRLAGFRPGAGQIAFAIERRAGGHLFQLNFSNGFGTTFGQLAEGAESRDNWYIGFYIARKFYR